VGARRKPHLLSARPGADGDPRPAPRGAHDGHRVLGDAGIDAQELWLAEMDKKGAPARATWNHFRKLYTECEKSVAANGYPWQKK
jgi:hypothetical protein